ncbi:hypothetical protein [Flindersiella endophytica]
MTSTPPPWIDDLFSFPTPPALRTLIDIAWRHAYDFYVENESYDFLLLATHVDFMFDLTRFPRPPEGSDGYPEFTDDDRRQAVPHFATPEFVPFGALGTGAYVGWLVPAPELGRTDHQVALTSGHDHGFTLIGADTRAGLEFMLSWALRRSSDRYGERIGRLAAELGVHPDPNRTYAGSSWRETIVVRDDEVEIEFDVPDGWRNEAGYDGIGVLAPVAAFADWDPVVADRPDVPMEQVLAEAARALDAGYPATALAGLKDSFIVADGFPFAAAKPLWARAYHDLGRHEFAERLEQMAPMYQST